MLNVNADIPNTDAGSGAEEPFGVFRNDTTPGANDGTPLLEVWPNELYYALYPALSAIGATPNNVREKNGASQFLDSLNSYVRPIFSFYVQTNLIPTFSYIMVSGRFLPLEKLSWTLAEMEASGSALANDSLGVVVADIISGTPDFVRLRVEPYDGSTGNITKDNNGTIFHAGDPVKWIVYKTHLGAMGGSEFTQGKIFFVGGPNGFGPVVDYSALAIGTTAYDIKALDFTGDVFGLEYGMQFQATSNGVSTRLMFSDGFGVYNQEYLVFRRPEDVHAVAASDGRLTGTFIIPLRSKNISIGTTHIAMKAPSELEMIYVTVSLEMFAG